MVEPDEGIEVEDVLDDREFELMAGRRMWPRLARRVGGVSVIDLVDIDSIPETPSHRKVLLLVLLLALKDRATEVHFEPWRSEDAEGDASGLRMSYGVAGQLHELVPPPACCAGPLYRDLKDVAGLNVPRRRFADLLRRLAGWIDGQPRPPRRGEFRLNLGDGHADVEVMVYDSEPGERYFMRLTATSEVASEAAAREMRRVFMILAARRREKSAPSGT